MSTSGLKRASFTRITGAKSAPIAVHFNPVSLQYTVTNTMKEGKGKKQKQYVSQSTGKLTMDLVFDTTHSGEDVRSHTEKIAKFMEPEKSSKVPPVVEFQWGTYRFKGMVESFKETIDFFAASGVPLRAAVNLTMARQDTVFALDTQQDAVPEPVNVPLALGEDATSTASRGCSPGAGRDLAAANGQESMRFLTGSSLTVGGSVSFGAPAAFAATAAAAGSGIFAGLRVSAGTAPPLCPDRLSPPGGVGGVATDAGATFELGGRAGIQGSASMTADVGASASLRARIQFEET